MTTAPHNAVTWVEIPVRDLDAGMALHARLLDCPFERVPFTAGNDVAFIPYGRDGGVSGHLYPGTPSPHGCTVHLTLHDRLEDAAERCRAAGGRVTSEPVSIGFGRFVYAHDPDGNSIGLFEPAAA